MEKKPTKTAEKAVKQQKEAPKPPKKACCYVFYKGGRKFTEEEVKYKGFNKSQMIEIYEDR